MLLLTPSPSLPPPLPTITYTVSWHSAYVLAMCSTFWCKASCWFASRWGHLRPCTPSLPPPPPPPCEPILLSSMLTFNVLSCATVSLTPGIAITVHLAAQTVSDFPYYAQTPPSLFSSSFLFCSHVPVCGPERCFFSRDPACQISCLGEFYFHSLCRTHICLLNFHCPEMSPWPLACTTQSCSAT